jgi:hypothetical protein
MDAQFTKVQVRALPLRLTVWFFAAALFTSAALLFWVQPLMAKMILPLLGGAPSVWNTCMVFFQAMLLAGYGYVLLVSRLPLSRQLLVHGLLLLAAGIFLPFGISDRLLTQLPTETNPTLWLLGVLFLSVGLPFFVLSATAPLLQRWFSYSRHSSAEDPYFLYAVSNAGSMLSLLAFPFLLEPLWNVREQSFYWAAGYLLLVALIACCAMVVGKGQAATLSFANRRSEESLSKRIRVELILLALIPSSLMLGVTTFIATDVASVPLIWIIPLSLYLASFITGFANKQVINLKIATQFLPAAIFLMALLVVLKPPVSNVVVIGAHLALFFLIAFICHRRIAMMRPAVENLPTFYLCVSIGGVLGGIFNALLAPVLFPTALEYPLMIIAASFIRPAGGYKWLKGWVQAGFPALIFTVTLLLSIVVPKWALSLKLSDAIVVGLPLAVAYLASARHRLVFAAALVAVMLGSYKYVNDGASTLTTQRNFFGVWTVTAQNGGGFHTLRHGSTTHGGQFTDESRRCDATAYYHKEGPLGQAFQLHNSRPNQSNRVAAIGLGSGTIVTYSASGESWDIYEIDPAIVGIASDPRYFRFLSDCAAAPHRIVLGDARLRLNEASDGQYSMLVLDAFSSDSVPTHLLTREALNLYLSKLSEDGILAAHVTNRYLNLEPVFSGLTSAAGLSALIRADNQFDSGAGKYPSTWIVIARRPELLEGLASDARWRPLKGNVLWTDEFSNPVAVLK